MTIFIFFKISTQWYFFPADEIKALHSDIKFVRTPRKAVKSTNDIRWGSLSQYPIPKVLKGLTPLSLKGPYFKDLGPPWGYRKWKVVLEFWFGHPKCHFWYPQNDQKGYFKPRFGVIILLFYHSFWRRGYPRPPWTLWCPHDPWYVIMGHSQSSWVIMGHIWPIWSE